MKLVFVRLSTYILQ